MKNLKNLTIDQLAFCRISVKYMKKLLYDSKYILNLINFLKSISAVFARAIIHNSAF